MMRKAKGTEGFSLVELMVALVILSVGMLALAATTGYLITQVQVSNLRTERATAVQQVVEELRATPFDNIASRAQGSAQTVGDFDVWWRVSTPASNLKRVRVYTEGPGYNAGTGWTQVRQDSFSISLARLN